MSGWVSKEQFCIFLWFGPHLDHAVSGNPFLFPFSSHDSHDSGFKVVGQPVLAEPKLVQDAESSKTNRNLPLVNNNNLGVIVEPNLGGENGKKADVIPYADRDRQVIAPQVRKLTFRCTLASYSCHSH